MSKQRNPEIGRVKCMNGECHKDSSARRDQGGRLYYVCDDCGIINPRGASFQAYMEKHIVLHPAETPGVTVEDDDNTEPGPGPEAGPAPGPEPEPAPAPAKKEKGFFDKVFDSLLGEE